MQTVQNVLGQVTGGVLGPKLPVRKLGKNGPSVTALGYGTMGLSAFYGKPKPDAERFAVLDKCYAEGELFWDSADVYQDSEDLLGKLSSTKIPRLGFVPEKADSRVMFPFGNNQAAGSRPTRVRARISSSRPNSPCVSTNRAIGSATPAPNTAVKRVRSRWADWACRISIYTTREFRFAWKNMCMG